MSTANTKSFKDLKRIFNKNPNMLGVDGEDHIRISPYGKTEIGKWLSPSFAKKVNIHPIGEFASVRNFWVWLTTEGHPDEFRNISPKSLEGMLKSNTVKKGKSLPYFTYLIAYAKYLQLVQHKVKIENTELPLTLYNENREGFRTSAAYEQWYVNLMKTVINAYVSGERPMFYSEEENGTVDIDNYLKTKLMQDLFDIIPRETSGSEEEEETLLDSALSSDEDTLGQEVKASEEETTASN